MNSSKFGFEVNNIGGSQVYPIAYVRDNFLAMSSTSYITYDLKWYLTNTTLFNYNVVGLMPVLDYANPLLLLTENYYGNYNRVTNDLGGSATDGSDGSTANYMIDNYTGLGYYMLDAVANNTSWNNSAIALQSAAFGSKNNWRMLTIDDVNSICYGEGLNQNIFTGIHAWTGDSFWIMASSAATAIYFWRKNQNYVSSIRFTSFLPTSGNAGIRTIAVRNHF